MGVEDEIDRVSIGWGFFVFLFFFLENSPKIQRALSDVSRRNAAVFKDGLPDV